MVKFCVGCHKHCLVDSGDISNCEITKAAFGDEVAGRYVTSPHRVRRREDGKCANCLIEPAIEGRSLGRKCLTDRGRMQRHLRHETAEFDSQFPVHWGRKGKK